MGPYLIEIERAIGDPDDDFAEFVVHAYDVNTKTRAVSIGCPCAVLDPNGYFFVAMLKSAALPANAFPMQLHLPADASYYVRVWSQNAGFLMGEWWLPQLGK